MSSEQSITLYTRLARADVAGLIEALADGLKEGVLTIQKSGSTLVMDVPKVIDYTVCGDRGGDRSSFTLEVSWRTKSLEVPDEQPLAAAPATPGKISGSRKAASSAGKKGAKQSAAKKKT